MLSFFLCFCRRFLVADPRLNCSRVVFLPSRPKPITLLLESVAAKDMSCLIAGYCRLFVDPNLNVFPWTDDAKKHRVSAEEGVGGGGGGEAGGAMSTHGRFACFHRLRVEARQRFGLVRHGAARSSGVSGREAPPTPQVVLGPGGTEKTRQEEKGRKKGELAGGGEPRGRGWSSEGWSRRSR